MDFTYYVAFVLSVVVGFVAALIFIALKGRSYWRLALSSLLIAVLADFALLVDWRHTNEMTLAFLLTDVASVKGPIVAALEKSLPHRIRFAGSHPMAGSEQSGIEAADAALFKEAACVVARTSHTDPKAVRQVSRMWRQVGGRVHRMDPKRHDALVAQISHTPHLAAVALTLFPEPAALSLVGGGFLDTTRIALSDPAMWEQICRMNRPEIQKALGRFIAELKKMRGAVRREPLQQARSRRSRLKR